MAKRRGPKKSAKPSGAEYRPDAEMIAARVAESALIALIDERRESIAAVEALKELARRRSKKAPAVMRRVVADPEMPADLRATAAVELGKRSTVSHRRALTEAVRSQEPMVVRRAAEALGRIGSRKDLAVLASLRPRRAEVKRAVDFGRSLISYRLGLNKYLLPAPPRGAMLELETEKAIPLKVRAVAAAELEGITEDLRRLLPAIPVSPEGAKSFACGENRFLIVIHSQIHRWKTLSPLGRRNAVVAVVLKRSQALGSYFVYEYVLTDPTRRDLLRLIGVRPSGVATHYGVVRPEAEAAEGRLRSLKTPYSPPLDLRLSYDHGSRRLKFTAALLEPRQRLSQMPERGPMRIVPPLR